MLQAKSNNGKLVTLFQYSKMEVERIRAKEEFYCPDCKEKVIIKAGPKTIAHFAHQKVSNCVSNEGGEGAYHEQGKLMLYKWLEGQGLHVLLEEYISKLRQRPDILLRVRDKKVAIEYQCTRISSSEIRNRTKGYLQEGIQPIWILGGNLFRRTGKNLLKVDQFILQFLHQFNSKRPPVIYYFDPPTNTFITAANLFQIRGNRMIGTFSMKKLNNINFLDLFKLPTLSHQFLLEEWNKAKRKFRLYHPKRLYGRELLWYKWLYDYGTNREYLPAIVYLPVLFQYRMITSPWDWQSRICLEIIAPIPIGAVFSIKTCHDQLRKSIFTETLPLVKYPNDPILEYLQILCSLNILKQTTEHQFMKQKEVAFYSNIEDALYGDVQLLDEISNFIKTKYEHDS